MRTQLVVYVVLSLVYFVLCGDPGCQSNDNGPQARTLAFRRPLSVASDDDAHQVLGMSDTAEDNHIPPNYTPLPICTNINQLNPVWNNYTGPHQDSIPRNVSFVSDSGKQSIACQADCYSTFMIDGRETRVFESCENRFYSYGVSAEYGCFDQHHLLEINANLIMQACEQFNRCLKIVNIPPKELVRVVATAKGINVVGTFGAKEEKGLIVTGKTKGKKFKPVGKKINLNLEKRDAAFRKVFVSKLKHLKKDLDDQLSDIGKTLGKKYAWVEESFKKAFISVTSTIVHDAEEFAKYAKKAGGFVIKEAEKVEKTIVNDAKDVGHLIGKDAKEVGEIISKDAQEVGRFVRNDFEKFKKTFKKIGKAVRRDAKKVVHFVEKSAKKVGHVVEEDAKKVGRFVSHTARKVGRVIKKDAQKVGHFIGKNAKKVGRFVKRTAKKVGHFVVNEAETAERDVVNDAKKVGRVVRNDVRKVGRVVRNDVRKVGRAISHVVGRVSRGISRDVKKVGRVVRNDVRKVGRVVRNDVRKVGRVVSRAVRPVVRVVRNDVRKVGRVVRNDVRRVGHAIRSIGGDIKHFFA